MIVIFFIIIERRKRYTVRLKAKRILWNYALEECAKNKQYVLSPKYIKRLDKYIELQAFFEECELLTDTTFSEIINNNEDAIIKNIRKSRSKSLRAYFAYLVGNMKYVDMSTSYKFSLLFLDFLRENSVFLIENSLKAIYKLGDVNLVIKAFEVLTIEDKYHNEKLISDGLQLFTGNKEVLNYKLLKSIRTFRTDLTEAIIDYWALTNWHSCDETIAQMLWEEGTPIDVICAIVRKLGKNENQINRNVIIDIVKHYMNLESCEPTIVGVTELGDYVNDAEINDLLLFTLTSRNWYVRINSAKALVKNGVSNLTYNFINSCQDKYAKDAFYYALKIEGEKR